MDGRTAEEVIAQWTGDRRRGGPPISPDTIDRRTAQGILAALADAGLVVCADGEANEGGVKVRVEQPSDYDGDGFCQPFWREEGVNTCMMRHEPFPGWDPLYRLVPLDGGEP